jgi:transposase
MGIDQTVHSCATKTRGWSRQTGTGSAGGHEWHLVDYADWGGMARHAGTISARFDVPPPFPSLGQSGCLRTNPEHLSGRLTLAWWLGSVRVLHRCDLCVSEKRGQRVGKTKRGKGSKIMAIADGAGIPIAVYVSSATPHETQLVESTLAARFVSDEPQRLIGDRAYDSDKLDAKLAERGIEMIAPHRSNRVKPKTQDGRKLRRFKRRWMIERLNAWLQNNRRIAVRYERKVENYIGFVHLACIKILLRNGF